MADKYIELIQQLELDNYAYADEQLKETYQSKKENMEKVLKWIAGIYTTSLVVDGVLKLNKAQKAKLDFEFLNLITSLGFNDGKKEEKLITNILNNIINDTYYKLMYVIDTGLDKDILFKGITNKDIDDILFKNFEGKMFSQRIWDNQNDLIAMLKKELDSAIKEGKSIDKVTRAVKNRFANTTYNSKRLCVTELTRVQTETSLKVYRDSDSVKKVMWDATLDLKTCNDCAELDGKVWDITENYPIPPIHPFDRCALIPVIDGWQPTKKRENIKTKDGKPIIDYKKYDKWLKDRNVKA